MIKFLIGGSPCTHWSIAQSKNRETEATGEGWELFKNYLIAKQRFMPDFFLYENNKSAAPAIKDSISEALSVPLQYINSALVSAQQRQRFYAHNCGDVPQPKDRGIILQDILETVISEKGYCLTLPLSTTSNQKSFCLTTRCNGAIPEDTVTKNRHTMVAEAIEYSPHKNSDIITTDNSMRCQRRDAKHSSIQGTHVTMSQGKTQTLSTSHVPMTFEQLTLEMIADREKAECFRASYDKCGRRNFEENIIRSKGYQGVPVRVGTIESAAQNKGFDSQQYRVYSPEGKAVTLCGNGGGVGAKTGLYACPVDNSEERKPVYVVEGGQIEIKGKLYPIKLADGLYIIRKLTVTEACRLQTMPDDYCRAVSATQAYRGLGNGWTAEVIIHILSYALRGVSKDEEIVVLSMYDGIGTGRYCFDQMGYTNVKYYAYEIDKYAMQISQSNYPDIIQCGDAFDVRYADWFLENTKTGGKAVLA